jgi:hypothetical protein
MRDPAETLPIMRSSFHSTTAGTLRANISRKTNRSLNCSRTQALPFRAAPFFAGSRETTAQHAVYSHAGGQRRWFDVLSAPSGIPGRLCWTICVVLIKNSTSRDLFQGGRTKNGIRIGVKRLKTMYIRAARGRWAEQWVKKGVLFAGNHRLTNIRICKSGNVDFYGEEWAVGPTIDARKLRRPLRRARKERPGAGGAPAVAQPGSQLNLKDDRRALGKCK